MQVMVSVIMPPSARIFHARRSRRGEEADGLGGGTSPPPHVGGYELWAFHAQYETSGPRTVQTPARDLTVAAAAQLIPRPGFGLSIYSAERIVTTLPRFLPPAAF